MRQALQTLRMRLRKRLPGWLRRALRLARHLGATPPPSAALPSELLVDCRLCASRKDLLRRLPKGGVVAEVGVAQGAFSAEILRICAPQMLHLIDIDVADIAPAVCTDPRVSLHHGLSHERLMQFDDASLDWVYIDGDHSYAGVVRDISAAAPKVKSGGYLVFNDFAHIDSHFGVYGVHRAVTEFARRERWSFAWWAYNPYGLYDVALRRPN